MKKICVLLFILLIGLSNIFIVKANDTDVVYEDVKNTLDEFIGYLNNGDEAIYNLLDGVNTEISSNVEQYLNAIDIKYEIIEITTISEDRYKVTIKIEASGIGWNVSGLNVDFEIEKINNEYKIVDSTLFDIVGFNNVFKIVLIVLGIFIGVFIIIIVIIFIFVKKNRQKQNILNNNNNNMSSIQ